LYRTTGTAVTVAAVVLVDVVVVVVTGDVVPDVLDTQLGTVSELDVQLIVDPVLNVLLVHTGAVPSLAVQLPVELLPDTLEPELLLLVLELQAVVVPLSDVVTVHPDGAISVLGVLPELLELDDPLLLELDDPPLLELDDPLLLELDDPLLLELDDPLLLELDDPLLLKLDDPPLLKLDEPLPELPELLLVEPDEPSLADTELSCARATCTDEARPRPAGSAVAPATRSTAIGRAIRRAGENIIRSFMRNLAVKPLQGSVRTA